MYRNVIKYTIHQSLSKKSRWVSTVVVAVVVMLLLPIAAYVTTAPKSAEKLEKERIEKVYIYDETGIVGVDYASLKSMDKAYNDIDIEISYQRKSSYVSDEKVQKKEQKKEHKEVLKQIEDRLAKSKGESSVVVHIEYEDKYTIQLTIPKDSKLKKSGVFKLGDYIASMISSANIIGAAKDETQLLELATPVEVTLNILGKGEENEIFIMLKMFAPMLYGLIIYIMLITYGQDIANSMVEEKNSKIIEMLVAMVKPKKLVIGKVLGSTIVAVGQIILWIISFIVGIGMSNVISRYFKKKDFIDMDFIISNLKKSNVESAFSIRAILIFVVLLLLGFLFYCIFAGICGSFISKPEEASSVIAIYTYSIVIGFMVTYFGVMLEQQTLIEVASYIPFCTPFIVPINILFGSITISEGLIIIAVMVVSVVVLLKILGTVYERLVFNTLSFKQLIEFKKAKKA